MIKKRLLHFIGQPYCKVIFFIFLFIICNEAGYAQKGDSIKSALYANAENLIYISAPNINNANRRIARSREEPSLKLTAQGGKVFHTKEDRWVAVPDEAGRNFILNVYVYIGGKDRKIASKTYRVLPLPDSAVVAYIGYKETDSDYTLRYTGGTVSPDVLLNSDGLKLGLKLPKGVYADVDVNITSFKISYTSTHSLTVLESSDGNRFSERQLDLIRRMPAGRTFYITGIKVDKPEIINGRVPTMQGIFR